MPEATINDGVIECGAWSLTDIGLLYINLKTGYAAILHPTNADLDDLYQVLHAWKLAQAYDKKYLAKVQKAIEVTNA